EGVPYVLFMSRLHEKKGLDLLIEAFGTATAVDYQEWRLVVAGTGNSEYESRMRELVSRLGLSERVAFVGWASGDRRHELLQSASCFALTSHQENFGLAVAEAMAVGLPVLVSEGVDLAEEVRRGAAGIVTPPQIGAIVDGLRALFEADRTAMGANAQRLARNAFAWDSIAASVVALYRQSTGSLHSPLRAGDTLEVGSVA
ncbi:MAG: glycosyltransferase, partial [Gemmatimonadota bacterium]|nr:glycosyltransferase [Gemmatimonadota bacterium]